MLAEIQLVANMAYLEENSFEFDLEESIFLPRSLMSFLFLINTEKTVDFFQISRGFKKDFISGSLIN